MNVTLLITLAGAGSRFRQEGYGPKPFVEIIDRTMIEEVVWNVYPEFFFKTNVLKIKLILICLKEHEELLKKQRFQHLNPQILTVDKTTRGAAETALLAKDLIKDCENLVITDSDHICLDNHHIQYGLKYFKSKKADAGLWNFLSCDPKYSYVKIVNDEIKEVVEKRVISDIANSGSFFFAKGKYFVDAAEEMIEKNLTTRGEFYVSGVYHRLIADGLRILPYMVNSFVGLGVPADYKRHIESCKLQN